MENLFPWLNAQNDPRTYDPMIQWSNLNALDNSRETKLQCTSVGRNKEIRFPKIRQDLSHWNFNVFFYHKITNCKKATRY